MQSPISDGGCWLVLFWHKKMEFGKILLKLDFLKPCFSLTSEFMNWSLANSIIHINKPKFVFQSSSFKLYEIKVWETKPCIKLCLSGYESHN